MEKSQLFTTAIVAAIIFLSVILYFAVADKSRTTADAWTWSATDSGLRLQNFFVGDDDTIYMAEGKTIHAIGQTGAEKWSLVPPDPEQISEYATSWNLLAAASCNGTAYLLLQPSDGQVPLYRGELLAVSTEGKPLWSQEFSLTESNMYLGVGLKAAEDRLYLYNTGLYRVYGTNGTMLWSVPDVDYLLDTDENGCVFTSTVSYGPDGESRSNLRTYYPNGTLWWSRDLAQYHVYNVSYGQKHMPVYHNGILYLWLDDGVAAVGDNGSVLWAKEYPEARYRIERYDLNGTSPFDQSGNIYLVRGSSGDTIADNRIIALSSEGVEARSFVPENFWQVALAQAVCNDTALSSEYDWQRQPESLADLYPYTLTGYDVQSGKKLWTFDASAGVKRTVLTNETTVSEIMSPEDARRIIENNRLPPAEWYRKNGVSDGSVSLRYNQMGGVLVGQDTIYLSYWAYNYEFPAFLGKSNCTYAGGIYALDKKGNLLWSKETDSYVTSVVERNGTIYYRTGDGKFSAARTDLAAGALAAATYVFLRIFVLGAVSRARTRLDQNENRSALVRLVESRPGLTLHEIVRSSGLNIGTVRYHLLILSLNHKIATFDDGEKYVRYFRNSGAYSGDEMLIISLARREQIRRLLEVMADSPGLPNTEIAGRLGIPESAVSKQLRILADRAVVVKSAMPGEKQAYSISDRFLSTIRSQVTSAGRFGE